MRRPSRVARTRRSSRSRTRKDKICVRNNLKYSDELVGMIKAIINQNRRERHAAGFKYLSTGLTKRISEQLGVNFWTVKEIKERRRRQTTRQNRLMQAAKDYDPETLDEIRQYRIHRKWIGASWEGLTPTRLPPHTTYKKQLHRRGRPE